MRMILLVDDDPTVLALERTILTVAGYDVVTAGDAKTALQILRFYRVDLVISDVMMPGIDGFRMASIIRGQSRNRNVRIAFFTAKKSKDDVVRAGRLQADFYVTKPVQRQELLDKVSELFIRQLAEKAAKRRQARAA